MILEWFDLVVGLMYISICKLIGGAAHLLENLKWLFVLNTNVETQIIIPGESGCVLEGSYDLIGLSQLKKSGQKIVNRC
jgi:hypothetical protein